MSFKGKGNKNRDRKGANRKLTGHTLSCKTSDRSSGLMTIIEDSEPGEDDRLEKLYAAKSQPASIRREEDDQT